MKSNIGDSLKWSTAGEFLAKIISPIANMILARILVPEHFGIVATVNMIISFADLFTDSGFAKYIIQADFADQNELDQYTSVAFWTNLCLSIVLWIIIFVFRFPIAKAVGNSGYENVIVIASIQLVATSFSSIQNALFRRAFEFRTLFVSRIICALIPLCITVPLALVLKNYWSLVVGSITIHLVNAVFLSLKSSWNPSLYFDFSKLKRMFSYSAWSLAEALAYWLITWFDIYIIGSSFSDYYVGIYRNSISMVNSIMLMVKASIIPVLFSSLSRAKELEIRFNSIYLGLQKSASLVLLPLGTGLWLYKETATQVLLGDQYNEAASIVGVWALCSCIDILFGSFLSEALKAKGAANILFLYEVICLSIIVPLCSIAKNSGFWWMVYTRAGSVVIQVIIGLVFTKVYLKFRINRIMHSILPAFVCTLVMGAFGLLVKCLANGLLGQLLCISACIVVYFSVVLLLYKNEVTDLLSFFKKSNITD